MRVGFNPNKDKVIASTDYFHQVIIPVHIPHQNDYFKDSFKILQLCLESLFKTCHSKTYFSLINNGSCDEVVDYLNQLKLEGKIQEVIHTTAIGKLNAILKGIVGHDFTLITISDSDVLFVEDWQEHTYKIYNSFPKAGVVSPVPSSKVLKQNTSSVIIDNIFTKRLKFTKVLDPKAMICFAKSIGKIDFYNTYHLDKYLTITDGLQTTAVLGAGHFVATYRASIFEKSIIKHTSFALGGKSEQLILDEPVNKLGYWRLSTTLNLAFHMGNVFEPWMKNKIDELEGISNFDMKAPQLSRISESKFINFIKLKFLMRIIIFKTIWQLFLQYKGLSKTEAKHY